MYICHILSQSGNKIDEYQNYKERPQIGDGIKVGEYIKIITDVIEHGTIDVEDISLTIIVK